MSKRKGNLVLSPKQILNYSSPFTKSNASTSLFSSFNSNDSNDEFVSNLTWHDTKEIMDELLQHFNDPSDGAAQVEKCISTINQIQKRKDKMIQKSNELKSKIGNRIEEEKSALEEDLNELNDHQQHLFELQSEISNIKSKNIDIMNRQNELKEYVVAHKMEASQEIEQIDEVEAARIREVPGLKHKISLYANITGIRWDFEAENILKGEIVSYIFISMNDEIFSIIYFDTNFGPNFF